MTKTQIQERQNAIWTKMDEMEQKSREANGGNIKFTDEEAAQYDALVRESAGLSAKAKALASTAEMANIRENENKAAKLRETIKNCSQKRENATTVLANKVTTGGDQNTVANLEAGGLIPVTIEEIIDTKVAGINLPDSLKLVMGVTGTEIVPYSTNDVQFSVEGEVTKVGEQALNFANIKAQPQRIAASVPVSFRAIDNAAFDIIGFITYKFQKGWAIFRALYVYAHGEYTKLQGPFAKVVVKELTNDDTLPKKLAEEIAKIYDKGFEGDPELIMDKVTEVGLKFKPLIPGSVIRKEVDPMTESTIKFTVPCDDKENMRRILRTVFDALNEKGYNPINQIVGYLLTEDPTYITNYNNARSMICKLDRDELMQALVRCYLFENS